MSTVQTGGPGHRQTGAPFYLLLCLVTLLSACAQDPTPTVEAIRFTVAVDTSTAPLVDDLVSAYLVGRAHVSIQVERAANTERALETLTTGQADLASVSWLSEGAGASEQWSYRAFARDSLVLITHPSNPVGGLTLSQLRDIYQGKILSWADLGGPGLDVVPVSREEGSGTRLSFEALVMGGRDVAPLAVVMPSNSTVVEYVSATPAAIGYVASAWLAPSVNLLAIEGVMPSPRSIETGRYLLVRPFYLVAQLEPSGGLAEFVAWVTQGEGREVVERGYALAP